MFTKHRFMLKTAFLLICLIPEILSRGTRTRNQWYWPTHGESTLPVPLGFYSKPPLNPKCVGKYEIVEPDFSEEHNKQQQRRTHRILSPSKEEANFPTNITFVLSEETKKCFQVYETYACNPTGASLQFFNLTGNKQIFRLNVGGIEDEKERLLNFNLDPISFEPCLQEDEEILKKNQCQSQFNLEIKYQVTKTHPIKNDNCVNLQKPRKASPLTRTQAEVFIVRDNPRDLGTICLEFFSKENCQGQTIRLILPHTSFLWTQPKRISPGVKIWEFYSDKNANPIVDTDINSVRKCSFCRNDVKDIKQETLLRPYASPSKAKPSPSPEVMTMKPSTGSTTTTTPNPIAAASKANENLNQDSCNFYECFSVSRIIEGDLQNWMVEMSRQGHDLEILPESVCYFYFQDSNCSTQPVIKEERMINETLLEALAKKHPKFGNWSVAHCEDVQKSQSSKCETPIFNNKSIEDALSPEEIKEAEIQQFSTAETIVLCVAGALAFIMLISVVIMAILLCRKKRRIREIRKRCIPKRQEGDEQQSTQRHLNFHPTNPYDENDYVNDITGLSAMCKSFEGGEDGNSYEIPRDHINIGNIRDSTASIVGVGEFSIALKGSLEPDGKIVAVKTIKTGQATTKTLKGALRECQVFMEVGKHPRIVEFLGVCTENVRRGELFIVSEWCERGSLKAFLGQHKSNFDNLVEDGEWLDDEKMEIAVNSKYTIEEGPPVVFNTLQLFKWCLEVADAMEFLSVRKIVHVSLSTRNILLDDKFSCKISDFHFAKLPGDFTRNRAFSNANRTNKERVIPWRWFAVESLLDDLFSTQSDVWTFGVFMWEIFSLGLTPFPEYTFGSEFTLIIKHGYRLQIPNYATVESYQLMLMCWYDAPEKRPTFTKLKMRLEDLLPTKIPIARGPVRIIRSLSKNNSIDSNLEPKTSRKT